MSEIVKIKIFDSGGEEVKASYVVRGIDGKLMRIPLYSSGRLKSDAELAELGLTVKRYTQKELDSEKCSALYAANPDLAKRVLEYKNYMDQLGLDYGSTTDDIEKAVSESETIEDKEAFVLRIKTAFDNVVLNLQAVDPDANSFNAWDRMPVMIENLPVK